MGALGRGELEIVVQHAVDAVADFQHQVLVVQLGQPFVPGNEVEAAGAVGVLRFAGIEQVLVENDALLI